MAPVETHSQPTPTRPPLWAVPGGRDVSLLVAARASVSAQQAMVAIVVPIYLARIGYSAIELGAMFGTVAISSAVQSLAIGWLADRIGRKPFLVVVPLLMAVAATTFAITDNTVALFAAAAIGTFGRGSGVGSGSVGPYQPAEQALLAGLVPDRDRNHLFGVLASSSALGALLGGLLAALPHGGGPAGPSTYRLAFVIAALLVTAAGLLAVPVREPARNPRPPAPPGAPRDPAVDSRRLSAPARQLVLQLWAVNATNGLAVGMFGPFVTYWFYVKYGVGTAEMGLLFAVINGLTILTNYAAAPLARRVGTVRSVVVARVGQAVLMIPMALSPWFALAAGCYFLRMVSQRIGMSLRQSFVMTVAPPDERATVAAFGQVPSQVLSAVAPTMAGYLFESVSLALPFELAGIFQLINAGLFHHFFARHDRPPDTGG